MEPRRVRARDQLKLFLVLPDVSALFWKNGGSSFFSADHRNTVAVFSTTNWTTDTKNQSDDQLQTSLNKINWNDIAWSETLSICSF